MEGTTFSSLLEPIAELLASRGERCKIHLYSHVQESNWPRFEPNVRSRHEELQLDAHLYRVEEALNALPLIRSADIGWHVHISCEPKQKKPVSFDVYVSGFEVTKPASPKLPTAAEMLDKLRLRLLEVEAATAQDAGPIQRFHIRARSRQEWYLPARSARQAAWLYSAIYLRNRGEVRDWKSAIDDVYHVAHAHDPSDWKTLSEVTGAAGQSL